jgi:hypothetical protein
MFALLLFNERTMIGCNLALICTSQAQASDYNLPLRVAAENMYNKTMHLSAVQETEKHLKIVIMIQQQHVPYSFLRLFHPV